MRDPLEHVAEKVIKEVLADGWGLRFVELRYLPVGGGAYHWIAYANDARRWFVTCDDLEMKPWLGSDRESVFEALRASYAAAMDLHGAGLEFVVPPVAALSGEPAERVDERHSVSVFGFVDGTPGQWGQRVGPRTARELVRMLARLHRSPPVLRNIASRGLDLPGRNDLEDALDDLGDLWDAGPLSELARRELAEHADDVVGSLAELDRFAVQEHGSEATMVITHGEPHPGNLIRTRTGLALVDWDTVAVARPERDLWMIGDADEDAVKIYRDVSGIGLDREILRAYRLLWALTDVTAFTVHLRREHRRSADAEWALNGLRSILSGMEPSPYGTRSR